MRPYLAASLCVFLSWSTGCRQTLSSSAEYRKDAPKVWEELLSQVVTEDGRVDYDTLEAQRGALDVYVAWLGSERSWQGRLTKDWHAQYLNAYNALVLFQVLERGRPDSVLDVRGAIPKGGFKFFHTTQFPLGDESLTLSEIENERLRWKEMDERDHGAMNCASASCPPLRAELYRTPALQTQLDDQMKRWLSDPQRGVRIENGQAVFNPIFDWFERDFSFFTAGQDPCAMAAGYVDPPLSTELRDLSNRGCPHTYFDYDWSLNDASASGS
ncbi:MAG: DUF547 domain-containing protein [Myxococcota bacterium]